MQPHAGDGVGRRKKLEQVEREMFQNLFKRNREEPEIDENLVNSTQRLMGRMETMLEDMAMQDNLRSIRFATVDTTPSYYR